MILSSVDAAYRSHLSREKVASVTELLLPIARQDRFCASNGGVVSRLAPGLRSPGKAGTFLKRWLNALVLLCSSCW